MSILSLAFLGSFQVRLDGQPVTNFESDKVRALLAYLAVEADRPHRRQALAGLLWPDLPETAARSNLRHALADLRRAIHDHKADPPFLQITRQTIQFNRHSRYELDLAAFLQPLGETQPLFCQLETVVALYRGEFLAGISLPGSIAFEEWLVIKREQCHQQILGALEALAEAYAQRGQFAQALPFARRQTELEPWDEAAHRQLIRLLALAGQRNTALAQYENCRRILEDELGIEPTAVTTKLYENIRDETWPDDVDRLPLPLYLVQETAAAAQPPRFVARERELAQLSHFLNRAHTGKPAMAFIIGESGSGKTALMQAFARQAMQAHPDLLLVEGKCSALDGSGEPFLPFREIMGMLTGDVEARWEAGDVSTSHARRLWSALPEVMESVAAEGRLLLNRFVPLDELLLRARARTRHHSPEQAPWLAQLAQWVEARETAVPFTQPDLFAQFTGLMRRLSRRRTLLLLLDDLHWIDSGSLNLLFYLGRQLRGSRSLILCAYRPGALAQSGRGQPHPLTELVIKLQQHDGPNQVDLSAVGGRPFIDALLDSEPNRLGESFRAMLHRQTEGQALFTVELLRGLQERGDLIQDDAGCWVESGRLDWETFPARVEAVIAGRIGRLPEYCRTVLTIASVEGERFTAEVVASVQKAEEQKTISCLSGELSRQHHLVVAQSRRRLGQQHLSRYCFNHNLFQKYLYNDLDPVERASLHEAVADALEKLYSGQKAALAPIFGHLAWHYREAGVLEKAISYCKKAGEHAWRLAASDEAIAHFQLGLALLKKKPNSPEGKETELDLQMALALPLQATKGFAAPEVRHTYDRAFRLSQQVGQTHQLGSILGFLGSFYLTSGQYRTSLKLCPQMFDLGQRFEDPLQMALARLGYAANYFMLGEFVQSGEHARKLIDFYDYRHHHALTPHYGIDPGVNGLIWAALAAWVLGYPDQAKNYAQEAIETARILEHPFSLAAALEVSGGILDILGRDYSAAAKKLEESLQLAVEHKLFSFELEGRFYQGFWQVMARDSDEGLAQMKQTMTDWRATGMRIMYSQMVGLLAEALGRAGRVQEGLEKLEEALAEVAARDERFFEAELYRIKGELMQQLGAETAAVEAVYQQAITIARRQAAKSWELRATLRLACLWRDRGETPAIYSNLAKLYDWFSEGFATPDLQASQALLVALAHDSG